MAGHQQVSHHSMSGVRVNQIRENAEKSCTTWAVVSAIVLKTLYNHKRATVG
jgi:hypothetical protein